MYLNREATNFEPFPAHAGMAPAHDKGQRERRAVPRTRRDDPIEDSVDQGARDCSPHTQG